MGHSVEMPVGDEDIFKAVGEQETRAACAIIFEEAESIRRNMRGIDDPECSAEEWAMGIFTNFSTLPCGIFPAIVFITLNHAVFNEESVFARAPQ